MAYNKNMAFLKVQTLLKILLSLNLLFLLSCSEDAAEDGVAENIDLSVTPAAPSVLPTSLKYDAENNIYETCVTTGVAGPRVRYSNIYLNYSGTGKLLIQFIKIAFEDPDLANKFETVITPTEGFSTISFIFGQSTDYLPHGTYNSNTGQCFIDFGGMPKLQKPITGSSTVTVTGSLFLQGVEVAADNTETPFSKKIEIQVTYFSASTID